MASMKKILHNTLKIICFVAILFVLLLIDNKGYGQKTWDGGAFTTNWGDANNWNPNGLPATTDNVTLTQGQTVNVNIATAVCNNLNLSPTGNGTAILQFNAGSKVTASGIVTLGQAANTNRRGTLTMTNGGTLTCAGFAVANTGTNTFNSGTGTVELTATNTLPSTIFTIFNNLSTITTGTTTLGVAISIKSNLNIGTGTTLDLTTYTANRSAPGGTLTVAGTMVLGGNTGGQGASNFPTNFSTMTMTGGTVNYDMANTQTVYAVSGGYNNLVLSGSSTKTFSSATSTGGDLSITSGVVANLGTGLTHSANTLTLGV
jgi:hypothetical protein